jgi:hypothetical protein
MHNRRAKQVSMISIAFLFLLGSHTAKAEDPVTMATIVEAVKKNEALYADMDVTLRTHYTTGDRKPGIPVNSNMVINVLQELETHYVSQGPLFRLEIKGHALGADGRKFSRDRIRAYDGATTRLYDQNAIGNLIKGRSEDSAFIRPHMLPLRNIHLAVPLSTYLAGQEAMAATPDGRRKAKLGLTLENSYQGISEYQGMKCHKVLITTLSSGVPHDRWELWLAEERNYLPVRMLGYTFRISDTLPVGEGTLGDLREIKPGLWFPFNAKVTAFNKMAMKAWRNGEFQWEYHYETSKASLGPMYAPAYFSDVEFPDGTKMYEVEDGAIKRSYIKLHFPRLPSMLCSQVEQPFGCSLNFLLSNPWT